MAMAIEEQAATKKCGSCAAHAKSVSSNVYITGHELPCSYGPELLVCFVRLAAITALLFLRYPKYLFNGSDALHDLHGPVLPQGDHPVLDGLLFDFMGIGGRQNQVFHLAVHEEQFKNTASALVTGMMTLGTALSSEYLPSGILRCDPELQSGFLVRRICFFAVTADNLYQAVGHDARDTGLQEDRRDTHSRAP